jgi:hypothetical protein
LLLNYYKFVDLMPLQVMTDEPMAIGAVTRDQRGCGQRRVEIQANSDREDNQRCREQGHSQK